MHISERQPANGRHNDASKTYGFVAMPIKKGLAKTDNGNAVQINTSRASLLRKNRIFTLNLFILIVL